VGNDREFPMIQFFRSLRRKPGGHRDVFAEFSVKLVFLLAERMAAQRRGARLRVVR
jgi:hypothetical protein